MIDQTKTIAKGIYRFGKQLWSAKAYQLKDQYWYPNHPPKPKVINLLANDICNSKCTMCNIWQQKQDFELTPAQLQKILSDPLFQEVKHVGVTGGEPTLREDLPDYYEAICKALPQLVGLSAITNAIKKEDVINRIEACIAVGKKYNKRFSLMVSLDGYGKVHDQNRGREGNFETAVEVIRHFKTNKDTKLAIGCTITKGNVWHVDELLDFLIEENIYGRFRIAEFISRLYNNEITDKIRNFDADERYHLSCFFTRLIEEFETNEMYIRTYQNIIHMLNGGKRLTACPYHNTGVVLDSRGNIEYCAPKSKIIGSGLEESGWELFQKNITEKHRIRKEDCQDCIHDYHAPITVSELKTLAKKEVLRRSLKLDKERILIPFLSAFAKQPLIEKKAGETLIFITGWYGTETVGDKAILAGIMNFYKKELGENIRFIISAIVPFITERTLVELDEKAIVIPTSSREFIQAAKTADITVMGGGPLMEIEELNLPLTAFRLARKAGKKAVVFGCGIGPLYTQKYIKATKRILNLATEIKLRDSNSIAWAKEYFPDKSIELFGDPARYYLKQLNQEDKSAAKKNVLACFLRDWPKKYAGLVDDAAYEKNKEQFESNLAKAIISLCKNFDLVPHFYCMHTFALGGDDRKFYRQFTKKYFQGEEFYIEEFPSSVDQIVKAMTSSSINVCMRFHSVLFAETLDTNFIAIDYTLGGKIKGYLQDHDQLHRMIDLKAIINTPQLELPSLFHHTLE